MLVIDKCGTASFVCDGCDIPMPDVDGDHGACYYTGRSCSGCDCGASSELLCDECEAVL